jgi:hypothetical protein
MEEESSGKRTHHGCRECNKLMTSIRRSLNIAASTSQAPDSQAPSRAPNGTVIRRKRGDDVNGVQPHMQVLSTFLANSDRASAVLTPSAKTMILKSLLLDWCKQYPDDKIIGKSEPMISGTWVRKVPEVMNSS